MKRLVLLFCLTAITLCASARSILFTLQDGTEVYYLLGGETNPVMKFIDKQLTVNADNYEFSNIARFIISQTDDPNAIEPQTISVKTNNNISVFTLDGKQVKVDTTTQGGFNAIRTSNLPKGIYIVKIGNQSMKVVKQ